MSYVAERANGIDAAPVPKESGSPRDRLVTEELERILASTFFKNAVRSRQFLQYVVQKTLDGRSDQLKERTIGVEVFQREPGYATGDDPVVRVQAGEVRRRLEHYYQALPSPPPLRIELPLGSYAPHIQWLSDTVTETIDPKAPADPWVTWKSSRRLWLIASVIVIVCGLAIAFAALRGGAAQTSATEQFWAPAFATPQPVFICLAKPVVYRPSLGLYQRYTREHPGTFQSEVERSNQEIPFKPDEQVPWGELLDYRDYGVAVGDAYAAVKISAMLGQLRKPSQVRIGSNYTFADLRNSPSVVVGAFNNKWTMQMTAGLHFAFVEDNGNYSIHEQIPGGRVWQANVAADQQSGDDYAIVARLLDSKTGQFTVIAAGITGNGTEAAGEFISNPAYLERGLHAAPRDWQKKNLAFVLKTTVADSMAGPPQVQASFAW